jgi:hypothetical protein
MVVASSDHPMTEKGQKWSTATLLAIGKPMRRPAGALSDLMRPNVLSNRCRESACRNYAGTYVRTTPSATKPLS